MMRRIGVLLAAFILGPAAAQGIFDTGVMVKTVMLETDEFEGTMACFQYVARVGGNHQGIFAAISSTGLVTLGLTRKTEEPVFMPETWPGDELRILFPSEREAVQFDVAHSEAEMNDGLPWREHVFVDITPDFIRRLVAYGSSGNSDFEDDVYFRFSSHDGAAYDGIIHDDLLKRLQAFVEQCLIGQR
ncbi:MAG: hypothetical protein WD273_09410 [Trueperaceae bacterium]